MCRTPKIPSVFCLLALILSLSVNIQAQTGQPVFRSPADAGRTNRYRLNLIRYNEAGAFNAMHTFVAAQAVYQVTTGNGSYGTLAELSQQGLIRPGLIKGSHGYLFRIRVEKFSSESQSSYEVLAVPRKYGITGRRSFHVNETGRIVAADRKGAEAHVGDDLLDPSVFRPPADAGRTSRYPPNLIRYNEAWVVKILRTLQGAEATYQATTGSGSYGTLAELRKEALIDQVVDHGHRAGYLFRVRIEKHSSESPSSFEVVAVPHKYGITGRRSFYVNETGAIVAADRKGAEANAGDDPLDP